MPCRIEPATPAPSSAATLLPAALDWVAEALDHLATHGLERPMRIRDGRQGATVELDGRQLINVGSNDYLGYAGDVRLTKAASKAACAEGFGAGASPLVSGHSRAHERLESAIANLLDVPDAVTFPSGFAANSATIAVLVGPGDAIFSDERNHASIIDGCRLSRAQVRVYPHRDVAALDAVLAAEGTAHRRRLIVTDTLFSMDGTLAPLADLCTVARRHDAMLMVDEAHATGVFGQHGSGLVEEAGCADGVHIRTGTLSKALGAAGGFVAGHADLIRWLRHSARAWIFSTAHPPAIAAAAARAIELVAQEPHRRVELRAKASAFRDRLTAAGLDLGGAEAQIVPVVAGAAESAVALSARLAEAGFFVPAIRPPSVPHGRSLVRASLSWLHPQSDLDQLADAIVACLR
jgi:8-amino-7-oxononanoate synthase